MSRRALRAGLAAALVAALAGCSGDDEPRLPGERVSIRAQDGAAAGDQAEIRPVPAAQPREDWTQRGGGAQRDGGHVQTPSSLELAWSADVGTAPGDKLATAGPVVAQGKVFARDGASAVRAFDPASGRELWAADLTPEDEYAETGYGGGLAWSDGRLFATTGFGEVVALDPESGEELWRHRANAPYRAAPAAADGVVVAVTRNNMARGIDAETGEELWRMESGLARPGNLGLASAAIAQGVTAVPFGSGELMLVRLREGLGLWTVTLVSRGSGEGMSVFPDVASDPVLVSGPMVIAGNAGGALAAYDARNARRLWQRDFGSLSPVWAAEGTAWVTTSRPSVERIDLEDGHTLWRADLPAWEDPEDREGSISYAGPVLAGGRVLVTSSDGRLLAFDPQTGERLGDIAMPAGSSTGPAVAGGTVYVLTDEGDLLAYR
ncbi:MAG: PQQ-binding-like beta-propeller repeat protein [Pseudomonadota bacterium]